MSINTWEHTMSGGINANKRSAAGGRQTDARALLLNAREGLSGADP